MSGPVVQRSSNEVIKSTVFVHAERPSAYRRGAECAGSRRLYICVGLNSVSSFAAFAERSIVKVRLY